MRTGRRLGAGAVPVGLSPSLLLIWIALATLCIRSTYEVERQDAAAAAGEGQPLIISLKNLQQAPHLLAPKNDAPPAPSAGARGSAGGAGGGRVISLKNLGQSQQQPLPRDPPYASTPSPKRASASGQNPAAPRTISLAGLGDAGNASPNQNPGAGQQQASPAAPQPSPPQERPLPVPRVVPRMPPSAIGFGQGNTQRLAWSGPGSGSRSGSGPGSGSGSGSGNGAGQASGSGPGAEAGGEERALSPSEQRLVTYMRKVYTALMEKEGPGAREDNAVFAITAEPGALLSLISPLVDHFNSVNCPKGQLGNNEYVILMP